LVLIQRNISILSLFEPRLARTAGKPGISWEQCSKIMKNKDFFPWEKTIEAVEILSFANILTWLRRSKTDLGNPLTPCPASLFPIGSLAS
jgi:hypothetical protein